MRYFQRQLNGLPIVLNCLEDATVVLTPCQQFKTIIDAENHLIMDMGGFTLCGVDYSYNVKYKYKEIPDMLAWLQREFNNEVKG